MSSVPITESLRETLAVFTVRGEPLTTPEVAQQLDLGRRSTYERLQRLVAADWLETKKVGASARVWWQPPSASTSEADSTNQKDGPRASTRSSNHSSRPNSRPDSSNASATS
ncbi:hypothetical protein [Halohasta litchfieldiae]|jgi:hypothetical protein|uniref:IclR helix-turn-helix domain-containing protein n=1 Tax=Halohasta litchfieldiae TaxID=1073996 RepID=A0A1H6WF37_9EURY|nr:hypothetical protein [Halohasta litchfieldiae]SEJ15639.1 hypothetical protein SAMN05444271_1261 [Halohasta litchfieldiae]